MATQAQLDAMARQAGFHDYATWSAYQAKQRARITAPSTAGSDNAPRNWFQNLIQSYTPFGIISKTLDNANR